VLLAALTLLQRHYLDTVGWSPLRRTAVEWPSLLALGPHGLALTVALVVAGALGVCVSRGLHRAAITGSLRTAAWFFLAMNIGVIAVAFSADAPGHPTSWHGEIHNAAYPCLLVAAIVSIVLIATTRTADDRWQSLRAGSIAILPIMLAGIGAAFIEPVAQLGRYFSVGGLLAWSALVARKID
jgi:hypothetical protein